MSSQSYTIDNEVSPHAVWPVRPPRPRRYHTWPLRVIVGCAIMVVGLCQLNRGLHELAGANYGTLLKVNQSDLYYTSAVSKADAERLRDVLLGSKICGENKISMQITKSGTMLQFRFVVKPGFDKDESYVSTVQAMGGMLSAKAFGGAPLEIHLCDEHFQTLRVVPPAAAR